MRLIPGTLEQRDLKKRCPPVSAPLMQRYHLDNFKGAKKRLERWGLRPLLMDCGLQKLRRDAKLRRRRSRDLGPHLKSLNSWLTSPQLLSFRVYNDLRDGTSFLVPEGSLDTVWTMEESLLLGCFHHRSHGLPACPEVHQKLARSSPGGDAVEPVQCEF